MADYTLVIGSKNTSSWSLRPWLAMKMAKIPFTEQLIVLRQPDTRTEILKHSPSGKIPLLKISEGGKVDSVWDSLAICETLAERHPDAKLWPADPAKRAKARCVSAEMHSGFMDVRNILPMDIANIFPTPEMTEALQLQIDRIVEIWTHGLTRNSGPFLFGAFTIADAFFAPVATRFQTYGIALEGKAREYQQTLLALEPMREWREAALAQVQPG